LVAAVVLFLFFIASCLTIKREVSFYWNEPEAVYVRKDQYQPVDEELGFLLTCDLSSAILNVIVIAVTAHVV
jgi:hypothetical protein